MLDQVQPGLPPNPTPQRPSLQDVSQFGQPGLSYDEALAACGPAAAVRLASIYGNNIPLKAAVDAAKQVGWTTSGGMNGIGNEKRLLDSLGIPATLDFNVDPAKVISDAQSGNPVTLSTPNHYFTVDGYDAQGGRYHVGQSGLAFRGGSEWMTLDQIKRFGGGLNGALYVDAPTSPSPSVAVLESGQGATYEPPQASQQPPGFAGVVQQAQQAVQQAVGGGSDATQGAVQTVQQVPQMAAQGFQQAVDAARQATGYQPDTGMPPSMQPTPSDTLTNPAMQQNPQTPPVTATNLPPAQDTFAQSPATQAAGAAGRILFQPGAALDATQQVGPALGNAIGPVDPANPFGPVKQAAATGLASAAANTLNAGIPVLSGAGAGALALGSDVLNAPTVMQQMNTLDELAKKYGGGAFPDVSKMTPADRELYDNALMAVGGMTAPLGEGKGLLPRAAQAGDQVADAANAGIAARLGVAPTEVRAPSVSARLTEAVPQGLETAAPQESTDLIQGLIQLAKSRGLDTSQYERLLGFQQKIQQAVRSKEPAQLNLGLLQNPPGQPQWLGAQVAAQPNLPGFQPPAGSIADKAIALRYMGALSSYFTHIGNIASNAGGLMAQPIRLATAGYTGEAGSFVRGLGEGLPAAIASFANTLTAGATASSKAQFVRPKAFSGALGRVVDAPTDLLAAADKFFQTMALSGYVRAEAVRLANGNSQTAAQLMAAPTAQMLREGQQFATKVVYNEDPGRIVNWLGNRASLSAPERLAVSYLIPFLRVPANITRRGVAFTARPVTGLVEAGSRLMQGDVRGARLAAADAAISGTLLTGFAAKAINGELSGEGPADVQKRSLLESQGWQPHSIRVGNVWYDYQWAGPLSIPMSVAANTWEAYADRKIDKPGEEQLQAFAGRMSTALLRQTFLSNIGSMFDDRTGPVGMLQSLLASTLVPNGIRDIELATDPYKRQADKGLITGTAQRIAQRVPGLAGTMSPDQDVLGRPAPNPRQGVRPFRESQVRSDPLLGAFGSAGIDISAPRDQASLAPGVPIKMAPEEQRQWNTYRGEFLDKSGRGLIDTREFEALPLLVRRRTLSMLLNSAGDYATAKLAGSLQGSDLGQRIQQGQLERVNPQVAPLPAQ